MSMKEINIRVLNIINSITNHKQRISLNRVLFLDNLLDSYNVVELIEMLEKEFSIKIPEIHMTSQNFNTVHNISNLVNLLKK